MSIESAMNALNTPSNGVIGVPGSTNAPIETKSPEVTQPVTPPAMPPTETKEAADSKLFASIARKEAKLVQTQKAIKVQQEEMAQERAELNRYRALKTKAGEKPDDVLNEFGLDYTKLTERKLNEGNPSPEYVKAELKQEIDQLRQEAKAREEAKQQEGLRQAEENKKLVLQKFSDNVNTFVTENADAYELINLHGTQKLVEAVIEQHYVRTQKESPVRVGKVLTIKEAADIVEKHLEEQVEKSVATKKWQARSKPTEKIPEQKSQNQSKSSPTLTNQLTPSAAPSMQPAKTEAERINRALAKMEEIEKQKTQAR